MRAATYAWQERLAELLNFADVLDVLENVPAAQDVCFSTLAADPARARGLPSTAKEQLAGFAARTNQLAPLLRLACQAKAVDQACSLLKLFEREHGLRPHGLLPKALSPNPEPLPRTVPSRTADAFEYLVQTLAQLREDPATAAGVRLMEEGAQKLARVQVAGDPAREAKRRRVALQQ